MYFGGLNIFAGVWCTDGTSYIISWIYFLLDFFPILVFLFMSFLAFMNVYERDLEICIKLGTINMIWR